MKTKLTTLIGLIVIFFSATNAQEQVSKVKYLNDTYLLNEPAVWPEEYFDYTRSIRYPNLQELEEITIPADFIIDSNLAQQLQNVLDEAIEDYDIKGLSAALSAKNGDIWTGVSGFSHDTVTMKTDMLLGVGSITKNFVATIILQLYEEGSLNLDDSLHTWLPSFDNIDTSVTIKQLLNHTSGIYNYTNNTSLSDSIMVPGSRIWTPEEILEYFVLPPSFPPGTNWEYSNTNYILLGMIIEEVTGNEMVDELHSRLTEPLGLNSTYLFPDEGYDGFRSHVWIPDGDSLVDVTELVDTTAFSGFWTAGSILSTPENLVRWSKGLNEGEVLADSTLELMKTAAPYSNGTYGLGTQIFRILLKRIYGHTGDVIYYSQLFYKPGDSLSIALMSNTRFAPVYDIWMDLYYAYKDVITSVQPLASSKNMHVYPNPASSFTNFSFELEKEEMVILKIYNQFGQQVNTLKEGPVDSGKHIVRWNTRDLPAGMYIYHFKSGNQSNNGNILIVK